ncbi:MAG: hypothetical protein U0802_14255 [Candidatus Binatia bacterium]
MRLAAAVRRLPGALPVVAVLLLAVAHLPAGRGESAQLVQDINRSPGAGGDSSAAGFVRLGDATYFVADDGVHGAELWRTGGTPQSTRLVADINPGRGDGLFAATLTVLRDQLYFAAGDTVHGCGLWKSDGPAAGTKPVYVFDQGRPCAFYHLGPRELTRLGQRLLFSADHPESGRELWASDGTAAGTRLVKNINQMPSEFGGDLDSSPAQLTDIGGVVLFSAEPLSGGRALWRSDGTPDGTYQISPVQAESAAGGGFAVLDGTAIFLGHEGTAPTRLWRSDGSAAGTYAIAEVGAVAERSDGPRPIVVWRDAAYFLSRSGPQAPWSLWRSDGTGGGTGPVVDLAAAGSPANPLTGNELVAARDQLFFTLWQGAANKLWRSDGTAAGTRLVRDLHPEPPRTIRVDIRDLTPFGDGVAFAGSDAAHGCEMWISDGSAAGTIMLSDVDSTAIACGYADFFDGPGPQGVAVAGERLFFIDDDGIVGREPWTSDGTPSGTLLVADVNRPAARTGDAFAVADRPFDPQAVAAGSRLIFTATDGTAPRLFATDAGAPSGAVASRRGRAAADRRHRGRRAGDHRACRRAGPVGDRWDAGADGAPGDRVGRCHPRPRRPAHSRFRGRRGRVRRPGRRDPSCG